MSARSPLVPALLVVLAFAGGWAAARLLAPRAAEGAVPDAAPGADDALLARLVPLERSIEEVRRAVAGLALREPDAPGEPTRSVVPGPDLPAGDAPRAADPELARGLARIESRLGALEGAMDRLLREHQLEGGDEAVLARIRRGEHGVDWVAWEPVLEMWRRDPELARDEVKLLTEEELLDRFGEPTDVWFVPQGITWQYARDRDPVTEEWRTEIILRVPDGYATQLAVRGTDW